MTRGHNFGHVTTRWEALHLAGHVLPGGTTILGNTDHAIVSARVVETGLPRRFGQRNNGRPGGDAIVARDACRIVAHAHEHDIVAILVGREIGADGRPGIAAV